jgi:hypothetical protein
LDNNLTVLQHTALCHRLFKADAKFKLATGVIPLCNNSALSSIIAMMPACNAHGPEGNLEEPTEVRVLEVFDNLSEKAIREEPTLIRSTTNQEVAYIASRAEEAMLAAEAGNFSSLEAEASEGVPSEEVLVGQGESAGEQSGEVAGSSNEEDAAEEQLQEEPPAPGRKKRILRKAASGVPAHQSSSSSEVPGKGTAGKAAQRQGTQQQPVRRTRRTTATTSRPAGASHTAAPEAGAAGSSQPTDPAAAKRPRAPTPSPCADTEAEADFDVSSFSDNEAERE